MVNIDFLKKHLQEFHSICKEDTSFDRGFKGGIYYVMGVIEHLEKKEGNVWILTKDELPPPGIDVIVTVRDDGGDAPLYYSAVGWYFKDGSWVVNNAEWKDIVAWRWLPEPHEGE